MYLPSAMGAAALLKSLCASWAGCQQQRQCCVWLCDHKCVTWSLPSHLHADRTWELHFSGGGVGVRVCT